MENMTPSMTTERQINKAVANFRALLEKHSPEFNSEAVQTVLGQSEFTNEVFALFRKRVEAVSNMIVRFVSVDRARTPQQVLKTTGRKQYINPDVVAAMPRGEGNEAEVIFFKLDHYVSDDDLEKEYELRGLKPADPYSLSAINEANPAFADEHPNATHWKGTDNKWCYAAFDRWDDERDVGVCRNDRGWGVRWWFAGLRK